MQLVFSQQDFERFDTTGEPPDELRCGIRQRLVVHPALNPEWPQHVFERKALCQWLQRNPIDPFSRTPLTPSDLRHDARRAIAAKLFRRQLAAHHKQRAEMPGMPPKAAEEARQLAAAYTMQRFRQEHAARRAAVEDVAQLEQEPQQRMSFEWLVELSAQHLQILGGLRDMALEQLCESGTGDAELRVAEIMSDYDAYATKYEQLAATPMQDRPTFDVAGYVVQHELFGGQREGFDDDAGGWQWPPLAASDSESEIDIEADSPLELFAALRRARQAAADGDTVPHEGDLPALFGDA